MTQVNTENRSDPPVVPAGASEEEYKVGPGRPPKEHQFKPGQSGNPKGAKRKAPSIAPDLKQLLERALNKKVTLKQGENERIVTMFNAGVEQLVAQFAKGDRHARRDVITFAEKFGLDLVSVRSKAVDETFAANRQEILTAHARRMFDTVKHPAPIFAPPELLDDDVEDQDQNLRQ